MWKACGLMALTRCPPKMRRGGRYVRKTRGRRQRRRKAKARQEVPAGDRPYLKSYSTVALAMISSSSLFVVYQRYFRPASGLVPDRGTTALPAR